jgi:hypothetical protein
MPTPSSPITISQPDKSSDSQGSLQALLDELLSLPEDKQLAIAAKANEAAKSLGMELWQPNPGSQSEAFWCEADEIGYGGEAGPGKTALIIGKAITRHKRSLILRRTGDESRQLIDDFEPVLGYRPALDRSDTFRYKDKAIRIGGCKDEDTKQRYKGVPYDFMGFDEVVDFTKSQYTFIKQWCRSVDPNQKCQVLATFNPPTKAVGMWVLQYWGPWLDPHHPRPAKSVK